MSSYGDNEAVFRSKAEAVGLTEAVIKLFVDKGFNSLNKFAFSSSYIPGSGDEAPFIKVVKDVLGRDGDLSELAGLRRLLHEAYALVTAELKQQLERSEDVTSRKLTQPERSDLYSRQCQRLSGLSIKGPLEPSDALVDIFCSIYDANRLRFVPWEKYTSREEEIEKDVKKGAAFTLDQSGKLKVEAKQAELVADTTSEVLMQYALQRRGLAMDQANLLSFQVHQVWVDKLMKVRLQSSPEGYSKVGMHQLLEADKRLFQELADETRDGVQATPRDDPWNWLSPSALAGPTSCICCNRCLPRELRREQVMASKSKPNGQGRIHWAKAKAKASPKGRVVGVCLCRWLKPDVGQPPTMGIRFALGTALEVAATRSPKGGARKVSIFAPCQNVESITLSCNAPTSRSRRLDYVSSQTC